MGKIQLYRDVIEFTEELKEFDGNRGFIMPQAYLDALNKLKK